MMRRSPSETTNGLYVVSQRLRRSPSKTTVTPLTSRFSAALYESLYGQEPAPRASVWEASEAWGSRLGVVAGWASSRGPGVGLGIADEPPNLVDSHAAAREDPRVAGQLLHRTLKSTHLSLECVNPILVRFSLLLSHVRQHTAADIVSAAIPGAIS